MAEISPFADSTRSAPLALSAMDEMVRGVLRQPGLTSDMLILLADWLEEAAVASPLLSEHRRLRSTAAGLRDLAPSYAATPLLGGEPVLLARALLRACPVPACALRMWRAAMPTARERWGWAPLLDALITAAEANERAAACPGQRA
jgi:hypothetical protein